MKYALCLLSLLAINCGDVRTPGETVNPAAPGPTPGAQAKLVLNAASRTDQQLDVSAQVLDGLGHGIPNVPVQFTITNGTVTPPIVNTDATGLAKSIAIATGTSTLTATTGIVSASATVIGGAVPLSATLSIAAVTVGNNSTLNVNVTGQALGGPFSYVWTFGDGKGDSGSAASITHAYPGVGTYQASVKVTDGAGRSATSAATAVVNDVPAPTTPATTTVTPTLTATVNCTANTHGTVSPCNVSASYTNASNVTVNIASQSITNVAWDWGDGTALQNVASPLANHTYAQAGSYIITATVTATTADGSKTASAVTKTLTIN